MVATPSSISQMQNLFDEWNAAILFLSEKSALKITEFL
jgi:hypothetical protein